MTYQVNSYIYFCKNIMNYLYEVPGWNGWVILLIVTFALIAFNELGRTTKWGGILLFLIVPIFLTVFVWLPLPGYASSVPCQALCPAHGAEKNQSE